MGEIIVPALVHQHGGQSMHQPIFQSLIDPLLAYPASIRIFMEERRSRARTPAQAKGPVLSLWGNYRQRLVGAQALGSPWH